MLQDAFDPAAFRALGHELVDLLANHLDRTQKGEGKVLDWVEPQQMLDATPTLGEARTPLPELWQRILTASNQLHHPRYVGHQVNPVLPAAALTELLGALLNNGMAIYEMGPMQTMMEQRVIEWMARKLGMPQGADGVLTHGGSLGNLTALHAARRHLGAKLGTEAPMGCILASADAHYCIARAANLMGLGSQGVVPVAVDPRHRMRPEDLPRALQAAEATGRRVIAVVASACSTATGSFDPIEPIADFCERHGIWLHVDGAHGASFALSTRHRRLVRGIERADSVVWDTHKMMMQPALATGVLFRRASDSFRAFAQEADYLFHARADVEWWNRGQRTVECTKRALAATVYGSIASQGEATFEQFVDRCMELTAEFTAMLHAAPDFELAVEPEANIVCFRHLPRDGTDLDAHQVRIRQALRAAGDFYVVQTRLPRGVFLRTTIIQPATRREDLATLLEAIRAAAARTREPSS
jgi:L-2,4-diaminobutyrate decarboxylase